MKDEKMTIEELREGFKRFAKDIDSGAYSPGGYLANSVMKRYMAMQIFGRYYPQYDTLSTEEKQNFGFDVEGLVQKVKDILMEEGTVGGK